MCAGNSKRLRREQQPGGGGIKSTHRFVGKQVAKDFIPGAVYVEYVTDHYPPDLENSERIEELFHVEYGDGDKEDMDGQEVAAAVALAAAV